MKYILIIIFLISCTSITEPEKRTFNDPDPPKWYLCPDGRTVQDPQECEKYLIKE